MKAVLIQLFLAISAIGAQASGNHVYAAALCAGALVIWALRRDEP